MKTMIENTNREATTVCKFQKECGLLTRSNSIIESFIRSCSHKLKSPLTSIEGLVMLAEYSKEPSEIKQYLKLIHQCATNMISMIHAIEVYTDSQKREVDTNEIKVEQLIEHILEEEKTEIEKDHIIVSTKVTQPYKWISDEQNAYIILKNLVKNAIQFSNKNSTSKKVDIKIDVASDNITLEVSDNGIGIPEKEQSKIFEPFHCASESSKGNGLGLFLVKGLLDKLKAKVSVRSTENIGTTVSISIPNNIRYSNAA